MRCGRGATCCLCISKRTSPAAAVGVRTPQDAGPFFRRNSISRGFGVEQNKPWLTDPDPKPIPAWLGGMVRWRRATGFTGVKPSLFRVTHSPSYASCEAFPAERGAPQKARASPTAAPCASHFRLLAWKLKKNLFLAPRPLLSASPGACSGVPERRGSRGLFAL